MTCIAHFTASSGLPKLGKVKVKKDTGSRTAVNRLRIDLSLFLLPRQEQ
ncbi:MAG: hypothetical protein NZ941_01185 [Candidatus Caldarchaeum sp.]|nr:hypothetical protein [Candidatus Caldarchaeum sp.]